jgi:hypothetical protein
MRTFAIILLLVMVCAWTIPCFAGDIWRESTFDDFKDGTFGDSGVNTYLSAKGRIQTVYRWDANGDGFIDLTFANAHSEAVQLDMSIYWGNGKDFDIRRQSYVPAWGPEYVAADDIDGDGSVDLVMANRQNGTSRDMDAFVYYGGLKNPDAEPTVEPWSCYPFKRRVILPLDGSRKPAIADVNRDKSKDILLMECGKDKNVRIYWGRKGEVDPENYTDIKDSNDATDICIANLNGDKWPEMILSGTLANSYIFWGGRKGYSKNRQIELKTNNAKAVKAGDVNNDGQLDLIFACGEGNVSVAYLNKKGKFHAERKIEFETNNARDCVIADFNNDKLADVFFTCHDINGYRITDSFMYFGSKEGFSKENLQKFRTMGAWSAAAADLNEDGLLELIVTNYQEHNTYEIPSFVYWNSPGGFDLSRRTPLFEHGAKGNSVADFNGDGHLDILIVSTKTTTENDYHQNYVYWGNEKGRYSVNNRLELPGLETQWGGMSDLDDDGQVDIIFSNHGEGHATKWGYMDLFIYWNQNNKFDFYYRTGLPTFKVHGGLLLADIDKNGYIDIIVGNEKNYPKDGKFVQAAYTDYMSGSGDTSDEIYPGSFIYWGSSNGYVVSERSDIPATWCRLPAIADLDRDGNLDIVFGNEGDGDDKLGHIFFSDGTRNTENWRHKQVEGTTRTGQLNIADLNKDGFLDILFTRGGREDNYFLIYYGDAEASYSIEKMVKVEGAFAKSIQIADIDKDGWVDLSCQNYWHQKPLGRNGFSHVLLGGPDGYSLQRKIIFPTTGGDGTIVNDFNFDGYNDIMWYSHREDGDYNVIGKPNKHICDSFLFWGGPGGFDPENKLRIPGLGVHFRKATDEIGNIYDRSYVYDYVSSAYNCKGQKPASITWVAETPFKSRIKMQVRVADSRKTLEKSPWYGQTGEDTYFTERNSTLKNLLKGSWIQYRAVLDTYNGVYSPVLDAVEIAFE